MCAYIEREGRRERERRWWYVFSPVRTDVWCSLMESPLSNKYLFIVSTFILLFQSIAHESLILNSYVFFIMYSYYG